MTFDRKIGFEGTDKAALGPRSEHAVDADGRKPRVPVAALSYRRHFQEFLVATFNDSKHCKSAAARALGRYFTSAVAGR